MLGGDAAPVETVEPGAEAGPSLTNQAMQRSLRAGAPPADVVLGQRRWLGNHAVQRLLPSSAGSLRRAGHAVEPPAIARDPTPAPAPALGAPPSPAPAKDPTRTFSQGKFSHLGPRFDADYVPVGPTPAEGALTITLKVHITFKNFTRAMMRQEPFAAHRFTREQIADFAWKEDEKTAFAADFATSVQSGWSEKHMMDLKEPSFDHHRAKVKVVVKMVPDAAQAHNKMTAQKVPTVGPADKKVPRFRSFVQGDTSTLEIRDAKETEALTHREKKLVRQVKSFANNSAALTPEMEGQIKAIADIVKAKKIKLGPDAAANWQMFFIGRTTSTGSTTLNDKLGRERATAVQGKFNAEAGQTTANQEVRSVGEKNAGTDPKFRRVDILISNMAGTTTVQFNTAAHEAGHMFGLDDEYVEEKKGGEGQFAGDEPAHYGDVKALMGAEAADELLVDNSGSLMSKGTTVKRGHYVYFLQALNDMTSKKWTVE
jgi:outer membrane protein OmpA-like peptidoglycan-associated protein